MKDFDLLDLVAATPRSKFLAFHKDNPHVLAALESAAERHIDRHGRTRTSIDYLTHIARFESILTTDTADDFKIGNSFTAWYARLLVAKHPEWAPMFEQRKSTADDCPEWITEALRAPAVPAQRVSMGGWSR